MHLSVGWEIVINQQCLMQDGATPLTHTANATLELLTHKFVDRVISQKNRTIHVELNLQTSTHVTSQQIFVLVKTSWRRFLCFSSEDVFKTSWSKSIYSPCSYVLRRRLENVLIKRNMFVLVIRLAKMSWRRVQNMLKKSCKDVFKTFSRRLQDILSSYKLFLLTCLQDVFNTLLRYIAKTIICRKIALVLF